MVWELGKGGEGFGRGLGGVWDEKGFLRADDIHGYRYRYRSVFMR
jgi:hypothetical protein